MIPVRTEPSADDSSVLILIPSVWASQHALSVVEAARIFGRSTTWVRNRITDRSLEVVDRPGSPTTVTVASVAALRDRIASQTAQTPRPRTHLRLVVDNTPQ